VSKRRQPGSTEATVVNERDSNGDALPIGSSAMRPDRPGSLRLLPDQPPGRSTRKALPYADEMRRLHAMGYTLKAIREALCAVGVSVSRSTVHREVRRNSKPVPLGVAARQATADVDLTRPVSLSESSGATRVRDPPRPAVTNAPPGKQDAEAFFAAHDSNPLLPSKETS
jgi:hypothetical protein